jgi:hypothetical protein
MCKLEKWGARILPERVNSMLYERTAISKKPEETIRNELAQLGNSGQITPDLVFRYPLKQIDAAGILDMAMSGTTATMLARRRESALLVNVDNGALQRLMNNKEAMDALMNIEGFRNLNQDIETIINKSEAVKKAKKEANDEELSDKEKKKLTEEEKEYKSKRKQIQEKLIKFAGARYGQEMVNLDDAIKAHYSSLGICFFTAKEIYRGNREQTPMCG